MITSEFKNMVGSFILGIVLTTLYFTVSMDNLKTVYITGTVLSTVLSMTAMYMGAKNIAKENDKYNKAWRTSESSVKKDTNLVTIIKKKLALVPTVLLVFGSWISSIFLIGLLVKHIKENKAV